jgi:uncharacterized protein YutE (UPF0331/DUF86 family)
VDDEIIFQILTKELKDFDVFIEEIKILGKSLRC